MHTVYVNHINEKIAKNKVERTLRRLFGRYGEVILVRCHKNLKMKGQAFVTFEDPASSDKAMAKLQNYPLFRKPITITPARTESDVILLKQGKQEVVDERKKLKAQRNEEEKTEEKKPASSKLTKSQVKYWKSLPPHNVLLLQNVDAAHLTSEALDSLFSKFMSFEAARAIPSRNLAFINFENEEAATACLSSFDLSELGPEVLLTYAKK